jgi:hypothetical protein
MRSWVYRKRGIIGLLGALSLALGLLSFGLAPAPDPACETGSHPLPAPEERVCAGCADASALERSSTARRPSPRRYAARSLFHQGCALDPISSARRAPVVATPVSRDPRPPDFQPPLQC